MRTCSDGQVLRITLRVQTVRDGMREALGVPSESMTTRHVAIAALLLSSCRTPYRPAGGIGGNGYRDSELGPGIHMIEVRVTPRTGYAVAHQYAHRRASELCPLGYDLADSSTTTNTAVYASGGTVMVANRPVALIVVQCR